MPAPRNLEGTSEAWHQVTLGITHTARKILQRAVPLVLAAELFNSALEALVDRLRPEIHPEIKRVKDMAAGAVLVPSLASLVVGLLVLISLIRK